MHDLAALQELARFSVYLLFLVQKYKSTKVQKYKSTNTDAEAGCRLLHNPHAAQEFENMAQAANVLVLNKENLMFLLDDRAFLAEAVFELQVYSVYVLSWDKSTNTDAEGVAAALDDAPL
jgi:hypothetical protein